MLPVCVPCRRFFRPKRNGFSWVEAMPIVNGALPGNAQPEAWVPYKLWSSDLMVCHGCGAEIIAGHARQPHAIQHEDEFARLVTSYGADLQVNDC